MNKVDRKPILQGCLSNINHQSSQMKQCLNENNLLQALKHCSNFLNELRINQLSPKQYYELYIVVFDSLDYLCNHLLNSYKVKQKKNADTPFLSDLYELVQYSGNIVPRLYMMIAVGTTFISTKNAPTEAIMKDMIEMCRGVQSPMRGLFLRYYLSQRIKDLLPIGNKHEFDETVSFLINNFIEMNKLWVRLQHQGHSSERELRYQERKELKILVGSNLVRLSQIIDDFNGEGYAPEKYYKEHIFPIITEQIIQCKDHLAQTYLIDVIIQIFPDNFHFITLGALLNKVFLHLNPSINISELINTLIERFINYHQQQEDDNQQESNQKDEETFKNLRLFDEFWHFYENLTKLNVSLEEHSLILQSFIKLSLVFEKDNYDNLNKIYQFVTENFNSSEIDEKIWLNLYTTPIRSFDSILKLLKLPFFNEFYNKITNQVYQKQISLEILDKLLLQDEIVCDVQEIDTVFKFILILIKESNEVTTQKKMGIVKTIKVENGEKMVTYDFLNNQTKICKVLGKINKNSINLFESINNLAYIKKKYLNKNLASIVYTYPTVILLILDKLKTIAFINQKKGGKFTNRLVGQFKSLSIIIDELYEYHQNFNSILILNLYLNVAIVADQAGLSSITFEFFNKCFIVYEERLILGQGQSTIHNSTINPQDSLNNNSIQYQTILLLLNKLGFTRNLEREDYQTLITKLTLYGSKLLKKQDQCRSIYNCTHLFWWTETLEKAKPIELYKDEKRVLECLQKSLRVADSCIDPYLSLKLFIEILDKCLEFSIHGNLLVTSDYINGLIELIHNNVDNLKNEYSLKEADDKEYKLFKSLEAYFRRTLDYIELQKESDRLEDVVTV